MSKADKENTDKAVDKTTEAEETWIWESYLWAITKTGTPVGRAA